MKIKQFLAAAIAVTTMFASCSKSGDNTPKDDRTVQIRIEYVTSDDTRAVGPQINDGAQVAFTSGFLLFTNQSDVVTWVVSIASGSGAYNESAKTVGIETLKAGVQITAVPGNSTKVHLIGNVPAGVAPAVGDALSSYSATVLSQYSQGGTGRTPKGGVANVALYGGNALTAVAAGAADEFEAEFDVKPITARFEIESITGAHSDNVTTFEYTVAGIFIDNYYDDMTLAGTGSDLKTNGSDETMYLPAAAGSSYAAAMEGSVYDYNATTGLADETVFAPSGVWAYNLLAPTAGTPEMAAIVIKLTDVKVGTVDYGTQFLTIDTFFTAKGGNTPLTQLEQGNIYVLDNIVFDENDFTIIPYVKTLRVRVKVNMMNWESTDIGWEL